MTYTASKSTSQGRVGYSISFRHPARLDAKGKLGLKVRRGLGTSVESEADELVVQMNCLLSDPSWWSAAKMAEASKLFDERVVDAFFDGIEGGITDSSQVRNKSIPLPSRSDGYARVLFVGTTGAGKTSLVRHLIGTDPDLDRFPSISPAKTTIADIEVIPADGNYSAVVTFFPEIAIRSNVEECVISACMAVWEGHSKDRIAERLLNHPDQRFRMAYTLGAWQDAEASEHCEEDWDFDGRSKESSPVVEDAEVVDPAHRSIIKGALVGYVERVISMAESKAALIRQELLGNQQDVSLDDREAASDIFQSELQDEKEFEALTQDLMDDISQRFDSLSLGKFGRVGRSRWPSHWEFSTGDRKEFLAQVRWFSSNYAPSFGKLLTPLVDGIRVRGPLYPSFMDRRAKLVLIDGQGLGHTPDSATSVTTHITRKFADVDTILLVDNAAQPIQAAAQSVLRSVAASGYYDKFAIAFTHFDLVKGLSLQRFEDRRAHVLASVHSYLRALRNVLSGPIVSVLEKGVESRSFMIGALNGKSDRLPLGVRSQIGLMIDAVEKMIEPVEIPDAVPVYDPAGLVIAVQNAASRFNDDWRGRLGFVSKSGLPREHHTRIRALCRWIGYELDVEYDTLQPAANLVQAVQEEVANFLGKPTSWSRALVDEEEGQRAVAPIKQRFFAAFHDMALDRVVHGKLKEWREALDFRGRGSASLRADFVRGRVFSAAAPVPGVVNSRESLELLDSIRSLLSQIVEEIGGSL